MSCRENTIEATMNDYISEDVIASLSKEKRIQVGILFQYLLTHLDSEEMRNLEGICTACDFVHVMPYDLRHFVTCSKCNIEGCNIGVGECEECGVGICTPCGRKKCEGPLHPTPYPVLKQCFGLLFCKYGTSWCGEHLPPVCEECGKLHCSRCLPALDLRGLAVKGD